MKYFGRLYINAILKRRICSNKSCILYVERREEEGFATR